MFTFLTYDEDFAHPTNVSIGDCVNDLEFLAKAGSAEDFSNQIT